MVPRARARSRLAELRPAPRMRRARLRLRAAKPMEPPIKPTPTMVRVSMIINRFSGAVRPRQSSTPGFPAFEQQNNARSFYLRGEGRAILMSEMLRPRHSLLRYSLAEWQLSQKNDNKERRNAGSESIAFPAFLPSLF